MSLTPAPRIEKHCLVPCPPERCNCVAGTPLDIFWLLRCGFAAQKQLVQQIPEHNYSALVRGRKPR
jgi:hypothetical protein